MPRVTPTVHAPPTTIERLEAQVEELCRQLTESREALDAVRGSGATAQEPHQEIAASEILAASILDQAQDAIVVCDSTGQVLRANQAAERLCGADPLSRPFDAVFPLRRKIEPAAGDPERGELDAEMPLFPLAATVQFLRGIEAVLPREDGSRADLLLSVGHLLSVERKELGVVITMTDVTDLRRTEEALRKSAEELARSNADLQEFASAASHDLQEPLRTVSGFVQLLQRKYGHHLDAEALTLIQYAVDGVLRMETLIRDLLAYSRVNTRAKEFTPTDAGVALSEALGNLHALIVETKAEISCGELPTVHADATQLVQLFQNLLGNALKFRGEGPPKIEVTSRREGNFWQFSLRDNGIGIEPKFHNTIFEAFRSLHTKQKYPGTGIGLATCKKIVDRHGGRIWVESKLGAGATFHFRLPI
jgi:signal transduction histidine kinase